MICPRLTLDDHEQPSSHDMQSRWVANTKYRGLPYNLITTEPNYTDFLGKKNLLRT